MEKQKIKKEEIKETKSKETKSKETKNNTKPVISKKTIIILIVIGIILILLGFYLYKWYDVKNEEKLMTSYLVSTGTVNLEIKNLDEVNQILTEAPTEYFVLLSYTRNEHNYKLESELKTIIDIYGFGDSFYYYNAEDLLKEDNYLTRINTAFNTDKITKLPAILYYKNGEIIDTVKRVDDNAINAGDFQKLLDIHEFKAQ